MELDRLVDYFPMARKTRLLWLSAIMVLLASAIILQYPPNSYAEDVGDDPAFGSGCRVGDDPACGSGYGINDYGQLRFSKPNQLVNASYKRSLKTSLNKLLAARGLNCDIPGMAATLELGIDRNGKLITSKLIESSGSLEHDKLLLSALQEFNPGTMPDWPDWYTDAILPCSFRAYFGAKIGTPQKEESRSTQTILIDGNCPTESLQEK